MLIGFWSLISLIGLIYFLFWIWVVADVLRRPVDQWQAVGHTQIVWLLAIIFFHVVGPVLYLLIVRPSLQRVENAGTMDGGPGDIIR